MRITIDLPAEQQEQLLSLAADRGDQEVSGIVEEALAKYLADVQDRQAAIHDALSVIGSFSQDEANELEIHVKNLRTHWR